MSRELLKRVIAECSDEGSHSNISTDLYCAIAEYLEMPEPEPVAYEYTSTCGNRFVKHTPPQYARNIRPLYTTPPDQSARIAELESKYMQPSGLQAKQEPLTERQIEIACSKINPEDYFEGVEFGIENHGLSNVFRYEEAITRAIENAHGILEE